MNNIEQNNYEEAAEKEAIVKTMHQPMKKWFFRQSPDFSSKFGTFPLFWQDFKVWEHFLEVKKHFLKAQEDPDYVPTAAALEQPTPAPTTEATATAENAPATETPTTAAVGTEAAATAIAAAPASGANGLTKDEESAKARKRKTRWGAAAVDPAAEEAGGDGKKKKRKSRWSSETPADPGPGAMSVYGAQLGGGGLTLTPQAQQMLVLRMKLQEIEQKILTVVLDAKQMENNPDRPASPPPIYDAMGKRVNTREVVMRENYQKDRLDIIEEMVKVNPAFKPPADYIKSKLNRKIWIPKQKDHPDVNFIGLIIGPRGNTQKKMERDTGCKIAIRGKGSIKDGSKKMRNPPEPDANDDLHVLIQGEREEDVERAAQMINELIDVDNKEKVEEHKASQLRQLAIINGTLREEDFCHNCGEKGHKSWECPKRVDTFAQANVKCEICGDASHITSDCPLRAKPSIAQQAHLDSEYMSFLEELGEGPAGGGSKPKPSPAPPANPANPPSGAPQPPQPGTNGIPTDFRPNNQASQSAGGPPAPYNPAGGGGGFRPPMPGNHFPPMHGHHPPRPPMHHPMMGGHMPPPWGMQPQWPGHQQFPPQFPPSPYGAYPPPPMGGHFQHQQHWGGYAPPAPGMPPPGMGMPPQPNGTPPQPPQPGGGQFSAVPPPPPGCPPTLPPLSSLPPLPLSPLPPLTITAYHHRHHSHHQHFITTTTPATCSTNPTNPTVATNDIATTTAILLPPLPSRHDHYRRRYHHFYHCVLTRRYLLAPPLIHLPTTTTYPLPSLPTTQPPPLLSCAPPPPAPTAPTRFHYISVDKIPVLIITSRELNSQSHLPITLAPQRKITLSQS